MASAVNELEKQTGKTLGGTDNPLLLSVRSGAYYSMPGMMDTILNLGLNDSTVEASPGTRGTGLLPWTVTAVCCRCTAMWSLK